MLLQKQLKEERLISTFGCYFFCLCNYITIQYIIRLQDVLSTKRKIFRETKIEFKAKALLLQDEIKKLKQDIERHEKKTKRFAEIQEKTFKELWDFSQEQIMNRLKRVTLFFKNIFNIFNTFIIRYLDISSPLAFITVLNISHQG